MSCMTRCTVLGVFARAGARLVPALTAAFSLIASASAASASAASRGFIENRGQLDSTVRFYQPGGGVDYFFTADGVVVNLKQWGASHAAMEHGRRFAPPSAQAGTAAADTLHGCAIYIRFDGANEHPAIEASGALPTEYNFFLGRDESKWVHRAHAWREVVYRDVWPVRMSPSRRMAGDCVTTCDRTGARRRLRRDSPSTARSGLMMHPVVFATRSRPSGR